MTVDVDPNLLGMLRPDANPAAESHAKAFEFTGSPVRVRVGIGALSSIAEDCRVLGLKRVMVVASPSLRSVAETLSRDMGGNSAGVISSGQRDTPQSAVDATLAAMMKAGADGVVAVGGGSTIGLGKTIAANTDIRLIAVPSTYSGSEMMQNWYVGAGQDRYGGKSVKALPQLAIYDPEASRSLPSKIAAASGMNAMAHAVESLYGPDTNPVIVRVALDAIGLLSVNLPKIVDNPDDMDAKARVAHAGWAAAAFRAKSGIEHALAQRIRQWFQLDHAQTHAVMLPYALAFNKPAIPDVYARLSNALCGDDAALALHQLNKRLGLATGLADLGFDPDSLGRATDIVADGSWVNPRVATRADLLEILSQAIRGAAPRH
ncbi:MAG: maleylacetate reductase [Mameliella sp.]|nr:maleylacetate reductase [Mameliella sp.]